MIKCCLSDISDIITGPFGSQLHESDYVPVGIPAIMPQNIGNRTLNYEGIARITEADATRLSRYLVQVNDIVYARRGDVEKHAFITEKDERSICGTGCLRVRITAPNVYPAYLSHYLNKPESKRWISQHAVGSNMPNLNTNILGAVPIELPSYEIQKAIADLLTSIDTKANLNTSVCTELESMAKTLYDYWFTQFDFPNAEGKPYRTSGGVMEWNELLKREIPKGWKVGTIDSIMAIDNNSVDPSKFGDNMDAQPDGFATIIMDELNPDKIKKLKAACHEIAVTGDFVKYKNIYAGVLTESSSQSPGVQLADFAAGIFNGYLRGALLSRGSYEYATDLFKEFVAPHLRHHKDGRIMGYGVREVPSDATIRAKLLPLFES